MDRGDLVAEQGSRQIQDLILEVGKDKMGNGREPKKVGKRTGGQAKSKETGGKGKGEICMRLDVKEGEIKTCLDWLDRELERMCSRFFGRCCLLFVIFSESREQWKRA